MNHIKSEQPGACTAKREIHTRRARSDCLHKHQTHASQTRAHEWDARRHKLVDLTYDGNKYDIRGYDGLTFDNLQILIKEGYADNNEQQNDSPTIGEIADFLKDNPSFTAHGYIVSPDRNDVRVSIEGVESAGNLNRDSRDAFINMFRHADEFNLNPPRAWYD